MVNANGIKHLGGNGAALNQIANPLFLKVVSRLVRLPKTGDRTGDGARK